MGNAWLSMLYGLGSGAEPPDDRGCMTRYFPASMMVQGRRDNG
ncbi:hypothetical protein ATPR_1590 [Acetobacter tropicalis NBRC 101654]|uniref:Uncharacterized protein n=1 Tax=Acetobacter tropicalis NBRC 101654 TaxID=749388 RepID=F7VDZ1_9PROT|nr:hypothetical protein ATPR_1590 [Acetobacter tropicalis NBRC 101654]